MKLPQLYLETSVWNFYYADDAPDKKRLLLDAIKSHTPKRLTVREEIVVLAQKYIIEGILPANKIEDAMHRGFR